MAASVASTATGPSLPPVESLVALPPDSRAAVLDLLFEPSPALHTLTTSSSLLATTTYPTYSALIAAIETHLLNLLSSPPGSSEQKTLDSILSSHPRLGSKKKASDAPEALSELSRREQEAMRAAEGSAGAAAADGEEIEERLRVLNDEYETKFGGLKYVTFVNGRPRPVIIKEMEARIQRGDLAQERRDSVKAMCDIALDRVKKLGAQ